MMNRVAIFLTAVLLAAGAAIAAPAAHKAAATAQSKVFTGEIWDQTCAKRGSHESMAKQAGIPQGPNMARECTLKCHEMGSPLVLYNPADKRIYKLEDQAKAKPFAGEKVKVTGTLDARTGTIHVESIAAAS
jgi:hypothetical protein